MAAPQRRKRIGVDDSLDRRLRRGRWKLLRAPAQAMAAVSARLRAHLAEVADERLHLAAGVRDEREHVLDAPRLGGLPPHEALAQAVDHLVGGIGLLDERVAPAQLGRLELDEALLVEVLERRDDPAALLAESRGSLVRREGGPRSAGLADGDEAAEEAGARLVEPREDVFERRAAERPEAVAGIERSALSEHAVELEVRERGSEHERAQVVA